MNTRPTPETDAFAIKFKTTCGEKYWVPVDTARRLESERDEARAEMIRWMSIAEWRERTDGDDSGKAMANLIRQRDEARGQRDRLAELHNKNAIHFNELLELCGMLRKERDKLAKALQNVIDEDGTPMSIDRANAALQSLTQPTEPISK